LKVKEGVMDIESRISTIIETFFNKQVDYYIDHRLHPCTDNDIRNLEQALQCKLPATFVEFLQWAGRSSHGIFGDDYMGYSSMMWMQRMARDILRWDREPRTFLPDDAIVIMTTNQDTGFAFFRKSEGDNPPVYHYPSEHSHVERFTETYTAWLGKYLFYTASAYKIKDQIDWTGNPTSLENIRGLVRQFVSILMRRFFVGCSHHEIKELEHSLEKTLPVSYKTFLEICGRSAAYLSTYGEFDEYDNLLKIQLWAREILKEKSIPLTLPESAFIFSFYSEGVGFTFFDLTEGDDPPVYEFLMEAPEAGFVRKTNSFSEFLEQETEAMTYTVSSVFPYEF
jgi:cell wall assembly regulator SMI1